MKVLEYICSDVVEHSKSAAESYDAVIASEVIEHVSNPQLFMKGCASCLKPGGTLVITTPNRTWISYFVMIFIGEHVMKFLPKGTHDYKSFIKPNELEAMATSVGLKKLKQTGVLYLPYPFNRWFLTPFMRVTYMMGFQKNKRNV